MRKGICVAGNMSVDIQYNLLGYPALGELVHVRDGGYKTTGGCVPNVLISMARLCPDMPLYAAGRNGDDEYGRFISESLGLYPNIDMSGLINEGGGSYSLVLSDDNTKQRSFLTYPGACARFDVDDIDFTKARYDLFHIGYILLLNSLDVPDDTYGTRMARLLHNAQACGIRTSVDIVSEAGDRFDRFVPPAMRYADYCVINEYEAEHSTKILLKDENDRLLTGNMRRALEKMKQMGVARWAVIHCPEGAFGLDENDCYHEIESLHLPKGFIVSTTGAGDAFCAGVLCGAEKGMTLPDACVLGTATAAASLSRETANNGIGTIDKVMELYRSLR